MGSKVKIITSREKMYNNNFKREGADIIKKIKVPDRYALDLIIKIVQNNRLISNK